MIEKEQVEVIAQADIITSLATRNVAVTFIRAFSAVPAGRKNIHVYRIYDNSGKPVDENVLFHSLNVSATGFNLTIDDTENLTGVTIEYNFITAT